MSRGGHGSLRPPGGSSGAACSVGEVTTELGDQPESWPVLESRDLYRGDWVMALRADRVRRPGADAEEPFDRWVFEHPGAVVVLAVDHEERACVLRQYRHPARGRFVELPAGLLDADGESPLDTAKRELREEVELEAGDWRPLLTLYPSAGISDERHICYLARDLGPVARGDFAPEHEEADMDRLWVAVDDLVDAVLDGRVHESPIAACVLAYVVLRDRGELPTPRRSSSPPLRSSEEQRRGDPGKMGS
jgi:8-oxo-dGDP phosphatase